MADFELNKAGLRKLEDDLKKKLSGGVNVPRDGSEAAAVSDVKAQLKKMGVTPNDAEVRRLVREARKE